MAALPRARFSTTLAARSEVCQLTLAPVRKDDPILIESVWKRLRREAEKTAREEPALAASIGQRVLHRETLRDAIVHCVASGLAGEISYADLADVVKGVCDGESDIVGSAAADLEAFAARDPSCEGVLSPLLSYKGFHALQCHRVAHALWSAGRRSFARHLQGRVAHVFSMDLHPGASVGRSIFIDHGTGIVIGETAVIDDNVSILHSVTLGGTGKVTGDRHPKVHEGVLIGAGAKILGNIEIGAFSKIAAGSVVLRSVPAHCTVAGVPAQVIGHPREEQPSLEMDQDIE